MKKSIIALLLVVSMVLGFTLTAVATEGEADDPVTKMDDLTVTTFFNEKTPMVPLKSGEGYTIEFHNKSNGSLNHENFILAVVGATGADYTGADQEIMIVRADNFGWGGGMSDLAGFGQEGKAPVFQATINWDEWVAACTTGMDVKVNIVRDGNTLTYYAIFKDKGWYSRTTITSSEQPLPETAYVFLTGENCTLSDITFTAIKDGADPLNIPAFLGGHKDVVALSDNETVTFKFHNRSTGIENFNNFVLQVKDGEAFDTAKNILFIRADNYGWGENSYYPTIEGGGIGDFDTLLDLSILETNARDGFDAEVTLSKNGNSLIYTANVGGKEAKKTATSLIDLPDTVYVALTGDHCVISDFTALKNGEEITKPTDPTPTDPETSEPEPTDPQPTDPEPTDPQPTDPEPVDDSVVIGGFNSVAVKEVTLKDGTSATFKFHNKSTGEAVYHNFVLVLTGTEDGKTVDMGYIRADNFADSPNYFGAGLFGTTNGYDQAAWSTDAKAGFDVEITITRNGKNVTYTANMGKTDTGWKYTDSFDLTSTPDLPESMTVRLTGEQCVLSNVSYSVTAESGSVGAETVQLRDEGSYTFEFNVTPTETADPEAKDNFALIVTDGEGKTVVTIYADGSYVAGEDYPLSDETSAAAIMMMALNEAETAGTDVKVEISRTATELTYAITKGDAEPIAKTLTAAEPLPTTVNVQLTAANSTLSDIKVDGEVGKEPEVGEITYKDADFDQLVVTTFFNEKSKVYPLKDGEGLTFKFKNKSYGTMFYENFVLAVTGDETKTDGSKEVIIIRSDGYAWGGGGSFFDVMSCTTNFDLDTFTAAAKAGFDVELSIGRSGSTLVYSAKMDGGTYTSTLNAISNKDFPETVYVFLTGENCTLYTDTEPARPSTPSTSTTTPPVVADPVDGVREVEKIEGNLNANEFFNRKTGAVALKSGESLTLTFKNQSHGVENFHNYVLALVGETGTPYPGAEKEILIIRADNYGWGGGLSDFGTLNFETNVTDWEAFKTAARAGLNVEILLERVDDTIHYLSKMGDYTFELTATSAKPLPETAYVFLAGERVTLTDISSVKGEAGDVEPIVPDTPETAEKIEGDLTVDTFLGASTARIPLWDGGEYTFKFHNKSNGDANWNNFLLGVTTGSEDVILIRADNFGWGTGTYFPAFENAAGNIPFMTNIAEGDWPAFAAAAQAGFDVTLTLKRDGDTLTYSAKMGDYTVDMTSTTLKALPETVYVYLSGEKVELTGITTEGDPGTMPEGYEPAEPDTPDEPDIPELAEKIEGDLTVKDFDSAKTNAIPLYDGGTYTLKFHAKSTGIENWQNFVLGVASDEEYVVYLRADNWILGFGSGYFDDGPMECNIDDWAAFVADAQAGFDVELTLSREGNTLTYTAKMGDLNPMARMGSYTVTLTATAKKALPAKLSVYLTGQDVELTGITTEGKPGDETAQPVDPEPTEPQPTEPEPTEPQTYSPKIEGTLDVDAFFINKSNMVPLRSGESYTFTFTNTSKGANNWENFVLAVVGATGAAYTGADQEILIIRADNWGWGGGMSDFVAPDAAAGNKLVFESNIDWDQWVAACKAGVPVTVTISRKGDTLTYDATIGDWFVKLTATSGKALPKTAYVFFTGENCTLSDIQTVSAPTYTSPKTGDTAPAILWIALLSLLATLAAAGVVVTKKLLKK